MRKTIAMSIALALWPLAAVWAQGDRVLTFQNNCPQTVWVGAVGGFTQDCGPNNPCPQGQTCVNRGAASPGCFWDFPAPGGNPIALQSGASTTVKLQAPAYGTQKWSGHIYGATGCDSKSANCQTGACVGGTCPVGTGPVGPTTLAEFTLITNGQDTYDISIVNGMNLPIEMAPSGGQTLAPAPSGPTAAYWCGNPGGTTPSNSALLGCAWKFNPKVNGTDYAAVLRMVAPGGTSCTADRDCPGGTLCGLAMVVGTLTIQQTCGTPIGWWGADEVCSFSPSYGAPFNCTAPVTAQNNNADLYLCRGGTVPTNNDLSCYINNSNTCCGCPNWVIDGTPVPATMPCLGTNPSWTTIAQPWAQFFKHACPMAYSFPDDDPTSTFNCQTQGTTNSVNYTITYCPGGVTGLPKA